MSLYKFKIKEKKANVNLKKEKYFILRNSFS